MELVITANELIEDVDFNSPRVVNDKLIPIPINICALRNSDFSIILAGRYRKLDSRLRGNDRVAQ